MPSDPGSGSSADTPPGDSGRNSSASRSTDSSTDSTPARPRAKRGHARVTAAMKKREKRPAREPSSTPADSLDTLAAELDNETEAISILRSSILVFLDTNSTDHGDGRLDTKAPSNEVFHSHVVTAEMLLAVLRDLQVDSSEEEERRSTLIETAEQLCASLAQIKSRAWHQHKARRETASSRTEPVHDNTSAFTHVPVARRGVNMAYLFVILVAHFILHATLDLSNALLTGLDIVAAVAAVAVQIPHDLRTAISWFPLDPDFQSIACCPNPECCKLFYPDQNNRIPERCDATFASWRCNWIVSTKYTSRGKVHSRPIRSFHCQSVTAWIGSLIARPGMEQCMEDYVSAALDVKGSSPGTFADIWHTPFLRDFTWGNGSRGFSPSLSSDLRLLFSLAIDWFSAHGTKQAGKKWSIGAIYLVCQNLPLDIRFRDENVCLVGIIPGRTKPLGHAINWFLQRLVDEFVVFYETGVWYTQTYGHSTGRRVWGIIGPVVCDLDAVRGVTGLGSVSHTLFCSICNATRAVLKQGDVHSKFEPRCGSAEEGFRPWYDFLDAWNNAPSLQERAQQWKDHAIRWTELARLRYWNPFQFAVVDPMHNLLLGLFRWHMREIWRMDVDVCGWGDEVQLDDGEVAHAKTVFARVGCLEKHLKPLSYTVLQSLASGCEALPEEVISGKKDALVKALVVWRTGTKAMPPDLQPTAEDRDVGDNWALGKPTLWGSLDRPELFALCQQGGIAISPLASKRAMIERLRDRLKHQEDEVRDDDDDGGDVDDEQPAVKPAKGKRKARGVALGRGVLGALSKDIMRTVLPDWIDRPPPHVGSTKHGKLSANHWRIVCTIHCVITLIRLWGLLSPNAFRYLALENFIHLVKAAELAMKRVTTQQRRREYATLIKWYLEGLKQLYPRRAFAPNHHLSTHLTDFLRRFGPPHSWWAFPFERYNGLLQKIKTNNIIGQMEKTIMYKFNQACRLKWLILDNTLPETVKPLIPWALERLTKAYSGSLLIENDASALAGSWSVTPGTKGPSKALLRLLDLPPSKLKTAQSILHRGMTFSSFIGRATRGNAIVHIRLGGDTAPARIREIAYVAGQHGTAVAPEEVYILVDVYSELSSDDVKNDPYRRWRQLQDLAGLDCHLRYTQFDKEPLVVPVSALVGHAAMCEYEAARSEHKLKQKGAVFVGLDRT